MIKTKVLIIGAGIAGLSLSLMVSKAGIDSILVEKNTLSLDNNAPLDGRTAALMGRSIDFLHDIGIWNDIASHACALKTMQIIDDSAPSKKPVSIAFQAHEINRKGFGFNIPNMILHRALYERANMQKNIQIITGHGFEQYKIQDQMIEASFTNNLDISAQLLIGADGKKSAVRQAMNIDTIDHNYDQMGMTCIISHSKPHDNISTEHHRTGGPFTFVPMNDGADGQHQSSLVWVEKTEQAKEYLSLNKQDLESVIQRKSNGLLGKLHIASDIAQWPLHGVMAKSFTAPRCALIAEAAHGFSPIGAQGLNLSLRDIRALADLITNQYQSGGDLGSHHLLHRYEQTRRTDIGSRFLGVGFYNALVSNNNNALRALRHIGLQGLKFARPLRGLIMRQLLN